MTVPNGGSGPEALAVADDADLFHLMQSSTRRCYVARVRLLSYRAILRFKCEGGGPFGIDEWRSRAWAAFDGVRPIIDDVSVSALAIARRWRARNPISWSELHRAPPLWVVTRADGNVELTEFEPAPGGEAVRVRELEPDVAYALCRFPWI